MGLFDRFKKKPTPCTEAEIKFVLFKVGKDWEFYKYDPKLCTAFYWSDSNGGGPDKDCDEDKPDDIEFEDWPFIANDSTEILTPKEAFPYLL